jgi:hypothetical protein
MRTLKQMKNRNLDMKKLSRPLSLNPQAFRTVPQDALSEPSSPSEGGVLGRPLSIQAIAKLIGCSSWSVRQKLIPKGLPHFRSDSGGKLIFYENQVVRWILSRQERNQ